MKAKIRVQVDRDAALDAIRALDAMGSALLDADPDWPKSLKRQYKDARRLLLDAVGYAAMTAGVADLAVID
jgi:hypothetical protein